MTEAFKNPPLNRSMGRPRSEAAGAHDAIIDAVYALLQERSVREVSMEAVAKRAKVGKPTLYKWWPSKAALIFTMFHERLERRPAVRQTGSVEDFIRHGARQLILQFRGMFGRVMAELIAEGQSDPVLLRELYQQHIGVRRANAVAEIERGKLAGEFRADVDAEFLVDQIFGVIYFRMLLKIAPLDEVFGDRLVDQVLGAAR